MSMLSAHEAMIFLMVITSASDRDMTDAELTRIGQVVRTWPVFQDFGEDRLIEVAQACQRRLHEPEGLEGVLKAARRAIPERLQDTAYAAAFEVAVVDLEMRFEEVRVLQLLLRHLDVDPLTVAAIERATKARYRTLT